MKKYTFHCQLKLKQMDSGIERLKFNAEFFCVPRINERIMFHELSNYFLENRKEGERLFSYLSILNDPISVTCKVSQIIHFDCTMITENKLSESVAGSAIGVLYLDELQGESICPTGAP